MDIAAADRRPRCDEEIGEPFVVGFKSRGAYTGDAFRLAFYVVLLVGIAREIVTNWRAVAAVAVLQERRRIARELHDGLAQDIAYIRRNLASLSRGSDDQPVERLRRAADRAAAAALFRKRSVI